MDRNADITLSCVAVDDRYFHSSFCLDRFILKSLSLLVFLLWSYSDYNIFPV
jgi:uncharacterized integral membrane protein